MNKIITIFTIFIVNVICIVKNLFRGKMEENNRAISKERNSSKPFFTSSFIQKWYAKDFTLERWMDELEMLRDVRIREIILQSVADTKNKYAVYSTELNG